MPLNLCVYDRPYVCLCVCIFVWCVCTSAYVYVFVLLCRAHVRQSVGVTAQFACVRWLVQLMRGAMLIIQGRRLVTERLVRVLRAVDDD